MSVPLAVDLKGKVAVVTGGGGVLCSTMAKALAETTADLDLAAEFRAGDLTVKRGSSSAASQCLYTQAELMIAPYLEDRFAFLGV